MQSYLKVPNIVCNLATYSTIAAFLLDKLLLESISDKKVFEILVKDVVLKDVSYQNLKVLFI